MKWSLLPLVFLLAHCAPNEADPSQESPTEESVEEIHPCAEPDCTRLGPCPAGTHLVHMSGEQDVIVSDDPNALPPDPTHYRCRADETCETGTCGDHGTCHDDHGSVVCACKSGYAGPRCTECAVGYESSPRGCVLGNQCRERLCSARGSCVERGGRFACVCDEGAIGEFCEGSTPTVEPLRPPPRIVTSGTNRSVTLGESRRLCAKPLGDGNIDSTFTWRLKNGRGTLETKANCAVYSPPARLERDLEVVEIEVCSGNFARYCTSRHLTVEPRGAILSTGQAHNALWRFDANIKRFMRYRCIGGAILGINLFGKEVYVRGYGNRSGAPTEEPDYLAACGDTVDVSGAVDGYTLPNPSAVQPSTPFRIGSNSKAVTAAVLRNVIKDEVTVTDTDDNVEAVRVCDGVLPRALHEVACLGMPPPIALRSASGLAPNCDDATPCPYGGSCQVTNPDTGTGVCTGCPPGYFGDDCSLSEQYCDSLFSHADSRWEDMTLGHVLGHNAGLPRSVPDRRGVIFPRLFLLRSLMTTNDWQGQRDTLTAGAGFPSGDFDSEFPLFPDAENEIGDDAFFVPRPTTEEALLARMGACLLYSPGGSVPAGLNSYSNTGYALLGLIAETVSGTQFAGRTGQPGRHSGSLLEAFLQDDLDTGADDMYVAQGNFALRNPAEPVWRHWSTLDGGTYYALVNDSKRPYCDWYNDSCHFTAWLGGADNFDWHFVDRPAIQGYHANRFDSPSTTGSLAVEAQAYLRFMARHWVGGDGINPRYGETRCPNGECVWTHTTSHIGKLTGGFSDVKQLGGPVRTGRSCSDDSDCNSYSACIGTPEAEVVEEFCLSGRCHRYNEYFTPPTDPATGVILDDFSQAECNYCRMPVGVDIFVAFNQSSDKKCAEGDYRCSDAYNAVGGFLADAVCQTDWPANPFVLWPAVTQAGGSSLPGLGLSD